MGKDQVTRKESCDGKEKKKVNCTKAKNITGSTYNSIEECSRLCPWLQRRGERACCNGKGGLGGLGRGRGRGLDGGGGGAWGWDSCGKADGKMMAWLLISGARVVGRAGPDDEGGTEDKGE